MPEKTETGLQGDRISVIPLLLCRWYEQTAVRLCETVISMSSCSCSILSR